MKPTQSAPFGAIFFQVVLLAALAGLGVYFDHSDDVAASDVQRVAHWAVTSQDHGGLPFAVIDKPHARLFAFDADGRLRGSTPVRVEGSRSHEPNAVSDAGAGRFIVETEMSATGANRVVASDAGTELSLQVEADFYRDNFRPSAGQVRVAYILPEGADADFAPQRGQPRRPS